MTRWGKCVSTKRGRGSFSRVHFMGYSLSADMGHGVGRDFFGMSKANFLQQKTPEIRSFQVFFGATGRIRTADLILTKGDFPVKLHKNNHKI